MSDSEDGSRLATFAAGCFWGVEDSFRRLDGVVSTRVGYTGGHVDDPDYQTVCTDTTGHAEAVEVTFDPERITYEALVEHFWRVHDPTQVDRQGPDVGRQYRSAIFAHDAEQERTARASLEVKEASAGYTSPIATEVVPAEMFWEAEEYHQQYFEKQGIRRH